MFNLPEFPPEVFPRSPLKNVICQVRFDEILRVTQEPVSFQEAMRQRFPRFGRQQGVQLVFGAGVGHAGLASGWQFRTQDGSTVLTLSSGALSLETSRYVDFPSFRSDLTTALAALTSIYNPNQFTRIGLRYVNEVTRQYDQGQRPDWSHWLNDELTIGIARTKGRSLRSAATLLAVEYPHCLMNFRYGFAATSSPQHEAEALVVDADYFREADLDPTSTIDFVSSCNDTAYRVFRWSIGAQFERRIRLVTDEENDGAIFGNGTVKLPG